LSSPGMVRNLPVSLGLSRTPAMHIAFCYTVRESRSHIILNKYVDYVSRISQLRSPERNPTV
jgi:hypothetical protein